VLLTLLVCATVVTAFIYVPDLLPNQDPNRLTYEGRIFAAIGVIIAVIPLAAQLFHPKTEDLSERLRKASIAKLNEQHRAMLDNYEIELHFATQPHSIIGTSTPPERLPHRLALLGPPGSGKTYSAVSMALGRIRAGGAVPIVFPASSLDVSRLVHVVVGAG